jgi:hypothetical protein
MRQGGISLQGQDMNKLAKKRWLAPVPWLVLLAGAAAIWYWVSHEAGEIIWIVVLLAMAITRFLRWYPDLMARRRQYWGGKAHLSDEQFLAALDPCTPEQAKFCLAMRGRMARRARVSENLVSPSDAFRDYWSLEYGGLSRRVIGRILTHELGLRIDASWLWIRGPVDVATLGEFLNFHLRNWNKLVPGDRKACRVP